ncbi:MAG: restriction endonuclease [Staphylothermus sp.]|nr:restriction endonuclease [Staphylothermus sp.]
MIDLYLYLLKKRKTTIDEIIRDLRISREVVIEKINVIKDHINIDNEIIVVNNPLFLATFLIKQGVSFKRVSKYLDWRDFERFSAEILSAHGYVVINNFRLTKPVMLEVDVIGIDQGSGRGIIIDCKHWSRGVYRSALIEIASKHIERVRKLLKHLSWAKTRWKYFRFLKEAIPLIVTLTTPGIRFYENTLIVSIQELNQVLNDIYVVLDVFGIKPIKIRNI